MKLKRTVIKQGIFFEVATDRGTFFFNTDDLHSPFWSLQYGREDTKAALRFLQQEVHRNPDLLI